MMRLGMILVLAGLANVAVAADDGLKVLHGSLQQAGFLVGMVPVPGPSGAWVGQTSASSSRARPRWPPSRSSLRAST